tara:strand:- start:606 stop:1046 length:441 start_codon:yes stop_codon:yes gene_type:complete
MNSPTIRYLRMPKIGTRVFVYLNLHKTKKQGKAIWSVKSCKTGRVIAHTDTIVLEDVEFVVQQAGRARVLRERKKNVHAGVRGTVSSKSAFSSNLEAKYNPYKHGFFTLEASWWDSHESSIQGIKQASLVTLAQGRVFVHWTAPTE